MIGLCGLGMLQMHDKNMRPFALVLSLLQSTSNCPATAAPCAALRLALLRVLQPAGISLLQSLPQHGIRVLPAGLCTYKPQTKSAAGMHVQQPHTRLPVQEETGCGGGRL